MKESSHNKLTQCPNCKHKYPVALDCVLVGCDCGHKFVPPHAGQIDTSALGTLFADGADEQEVAV